MKMEYIEVSGTTASFDDEFNEPLTDEVLDEIKKYEKFYFGENFNQSIDNLKDGTKQLEFGANFNQPINHLPSTVKEVLFGDNFQQSIDNLPDTLEEISLDYEYDCNIQKLPSSLKTLSIYDTQEPENDQEEFLLKLDIPKNKLPKNLELILLGKIQLNFKPSNKRTR